MTTVSPAELYTVLAGNLHIYQPPRRISIPQNRGTKPLDLPIPYSNGSLPLDFNGNITNKCYLPLAKAEVFQRLNFDAGSTLLGWMEVHQPETYKTIIESDKKSQEHYGGHGTALLLASFNHTILPLQKIQISGTDKSKTPYLDPSMPYKVVLDDKSSIAVFFRDEEISDNIAFGRAGVFGSSERLIQRWYEAKNDSRQHNQALIIATDGETFGEHNGCGELVLAGAINMLKAGQIDNLAYFLERNPPTWEAKLKQNTSWSCIEHGLGHWGENELCMCEFPVGGNSQWRVDLRNTYNFARDRMHELFENLGNEFFKDPIKARNEYIDVISAESSDRYLDALNDFLDKHLKRGVSKFHYGNTAYKLLEMEKFVMLMYTSCAWFWRDPNRIEAYATQVYLHTALSLYKDITGDPTVEHEVINMLSKIRNSPETVDIFRGIYNNIYRNPNVSPQAKLIAA